MHREYQPQQARTSATPQPLPLILLHITILPVQMPYPLDVMVKIMPEWLVENYKVLEEKLEDIVLMRRGLLIQHPRDEYDVLEERILESLELKTPRLLTCGHFVAPDSDDEGACGHDDEHIHVADDGVGRGSRMSGGTVTADGDPELRYPTPTSDDTGACMDCHRQVKKPGHGVGAGTKRWDIKIYAANGLMRAGAWIAAWNEMERCDVEISPWIPHEVRKILDQRLEQEQEKANAKALYAAELQRQMEEEAAVHRKLEEQAEAKRRSEETELQVKTEADAVMLQRRLVEEAAEKEKLEETLTKKIEEAKEAIRVEFEAQALKETNGVAERFRALEDALKVERAKAAVRVPHVLQLPHISSRSRSRSRHRSRSRSRRPRIEEIPLGTLLKNYFVLQLQDSRNLFILILGALVVYLLTSPNPNWNLPQPTMNSAADVHLEHIGEPVFPVVITSTAMMTATSFSTLVVTEVQTSDSSQKSLSLPSPETTVVEELGFTTSQSLEAESSAMILPSVENEIAGDSEDRASLILEELAEQGVSEDDAATIRDRLVSTEDTPESVASSESLTSIIVAAAVDFSTLTESMSPHITINVPDAEESVAGESIAAEPMAEEISAQELRAEPPGTEELDAPLEAVSPTAESLINEEDAEAETLDKGSPGVAQEDEAPVLSEEDALSAVHDEDEL
jgi:hypothetical protein